MDSDQDQFTIQVTDNTFSFEPGDLTVADPYTFWDTAPNLPSGTLQLQGEDADIIINGTSLSKTLQSLNDRLAILQVNPELEAEFDELQAIAEKYRSLEKKLLEKKKVWAALNKT